MNDSNTPISRVKCDAADCIHHCEKEDCTAGKINVKTEKTEGGLETCCATFKCE